MPEPRSIGESMAPAHCPDVTYPTSSGWPRVYGAAMSLRTDRREWNDLAQEDGMWAVHSDPQRRGSGTPDDFFATGEHEIATTMKGLEDHGLLPSRTGRALDFGCGLGRL